MQPNVKQNIINGFRACGISPLDREEVLKHIPPTSQADAADALDQSLLDHLMSQRSGSQPQTSRKRSRLSVLPGRSVSNTGAADSSEDSPEESEQEDEVMEKVMKRRRITLSCHTVKDQPQQEQHSCW